MNARTQRPQRAVRKPLFQRGPQSIRGDKDPDFQYRFVNDTGSRIDNYKEAGWELVSDESIQVGDSRAKDSSDLGSAKRVISDNGQVQYLMRIKKEWYEEDQAAKRQMLEEQERALKPDASQGLFGKIEIK